MIVDSCYMYLVGSCCLVGWFVVCWMDVGRLIVLNISVRVYVQIESSAKYTHVVYNIVVSLECYIHNYLTVVANSCGCYIGNFIINFR